MKALETKKSIGDRLNYQNIRQLALIALTAIAFYLCYKFVIPFLPAFALALALASITSPIHNLIQKYFKHANLAAGLSVFLVAVAVVAPAVFLGRQIFREVERGVSEIRGQVKSKDWRVELEQNPRLAAVLNWLETEVDLKSSADGIAGELPVYISNFLVGSGQAILQLLIAFFILFFFFRDKEKILQSIRELLPLSDKEADNFFIRLRDTLHASVNSLPIVAIVQGTLGGLMFWLLGLSAPIMWGFVMGIAGLMPFLGTWMIWLPAAIYLALSGGWIKALILLVWGFIAVSMIDNLLYPKLVGNRLHFHTLLIFIAFLGGVSVFGVVGIVLGPMVLAITSVLLEIWRERRKTQIED